MTLFPINTKEKDKKIPITKICVTFKLVNFRPCSVDIIFHIDKMQVKKFEGEGNKDSDGEEELGFTNEKEQVKNVNFAFEDGGVQEKGQVLTPFNLENVSDHFDKLIDIDSLQNKEKIVKRKHSQNKNMYLLFFFWVVIGFKTEITIMHKVRKIR